MQLNLSVSKFNPRLDYYLSLSLTLEFVRELLDSYEGLDFDVSESVLYRQDKLAQVTTLPVLATIFLFKIHNNDSQLICP